MGIPPDALLADPAAPHLEVRVVDDYGLIWRGEDHSLTSLTARLAQEMRLPTSRDLWTFEGRSLGVIYDETYGEKAKAGRRPASVDSLRVVLKVMAERKTIFDDADEAVESSAIKRAREEIAAGRDLSQEVVGAWLQRLASGEIVPPPTSD
jgi:hypothetical protein